MKASDAKNPQLDQKWWSKRKSKRLKPTGLGKAIAAYVKAKDAIPSSHDVKELAEAKKKLKELAAVRAKAENMAAKDGAKIKDTFDALKNYQKVITKEDQALAAIAKEYAERDKKHKNVLTSFEKLKKEINVVQVSLTGVFQRDIVKPKLKEVPNDFLNKCHTVLEKLKKSIEPKRDAAHRLWRTEVEAKATNAQKAMYKKCTDQYTKVANWPYDVLKSIQTESSSNIVKHFT